MQSEEVKEKSVDSNYRSSNIKSKESDFVSNDIKGAEINFYPKENNDSLNLNEDQDSIQEINWIPSN